MAICDYTGERCDHYEIEDCEDCPIYKNLNREDNLLKNAEEWWGRMSRRQKLKIASAYYSGNLGNAEPIHEHGVVEDLFDDSVIGVSLCKSCYCMTKTIAKCGKCGESKQVQEESE